VKAMMIVSAPMPLSSSPDSSEPMVRRRWKAPMRSRT
jgi:hypothetical protein